MAGMTGKSAWIKFGAVTLNNGVAAGGRYQSLSATETGGVVDASAGADTVRTYLTTLKDGTATASILMETGVGTLIWKAIAPLTSGTLWWAEEGSSSNKQEHHVWAIVTERRKTVGYADLIVADVTWQFSGSVTDTKF